MVWNRHLTQPLQRPTYLRKLQPPTARSEPLLLRDDQLKLNRKLIESQATHWLPLLLWQLPLQHQEEQDKREQGMVYSRELWDKRLLWLTQPQLLLEIQEDKVLREDVLKPSCLLAKRMLVYVKEPVRAVHVPEERPTQRWRLLPVARERHLLWQRTPRT